MQDQLLSFFSLDSVTTTRSEQERTSSGFLYPLPVPASPIGRAPTEEEDRFRLAALGSRTGIWDWDLVTGNAYFSPIYGELLGYPQDDPAPDSRIADFEARLHPDERERIRDIHIAHLENRAPYDFEFRIRTRSGTYQWYRNRGRAFHDTAGRPVRMLGTIHEINARRRVLEELTQRERKFRSVIETAASVIIGINLDYTIFEWNTEAEHVIGVKREAALGQSYLSLAVPAELREEITRRIAAAFHGHPIRNYEIPVTPAPAAGATSGNVATPILLWNISRLLDAHDLPSGAILVGLDITERKRAEQELHQSRRLKAVGELAAGVAHEFNNILTPMLLHVENVTAQLGDRPGLQDDLAAVDRAIHSAANLVSRIMQMSKPGNEKLELLRLSDIAGETLQFIHRTLDRRIRIETAFDPDLPPALYNRGSLSQALINLILNAKDALVDKLDKASEGGDPAWVPTIVVGTRALIAQPPATATASGKPEPFQQLYVTDNGTGMSTETRQWVFQPFFTTKGPRKGTGLGLAAVWSFVEAVGGFIDLESRLGHGTTFRLNLPRRTQSEEPAGKKPPGKAQPAAPANPALGRQILYAEDDDFVAGAIGAFLLRQGFVVSRQADGLAALRAYEAEPRRWDLVLTDLNMPNLSGLDLIRELRRAPRDYRGKIVVFSGMISEEAQQQLEELGVAAILSKPLLPQALRDKLWEILTPAEDAWDI
ncbi:PAS domain S-box-containing protein [Verrucomicrobium sp. GAS474]|uniref:hybrid sensor histidine kinase/response regulator n=1 Tax=Verrucomicrobium sp. GAS474 TaxID=1882831 RepID=UPI00087BEADD|nr:hybrid sensor histidine kinase/response regulator [Verrucomicrobium sp. GAS474]SDU27989.1 PAS domain S-box-containing protein [Verrucomicrobium sp. GAS474]